MVCSRCPRQNRYYQIVLKKKCLQKLRDNVWETKWKWIWFEKADSHYRLKILRKCFQALIIYSNESFLKKVNRKFSETFYREKILSRVIEAFKRNVERNRLMIDMFGKKIEWNQKTKVWHKWKHYTQMRLKVRKIKNLADKIRQERLTIHFLYVWFMRLKEEVYHQETNTRALNRWQSYLRRKYFVLWTVYTRRKLSKKQRKLTSDTKHCQILLRRCFRAWLRHSKRKKTLKIACQNERKQQENKLILRYLNVWKEKYETSCLKRETLNENTAVGFHQRKLLKKCFQKLRNWKNRVVIVREKTEDFQVQSNRILLEFYLGFWMQKRREKLHWNELEKKAKEFRQVYLLELYLGRMVQKLEEKKEESEKEFEADRYANFIVICKAFKYWKEFTEYKITKKTLLENSIKFYQNNLLKKVLDAMRNYAEMKWTKKIAMEHWRISSFRKFFDAWRILLEERKSTLKRVVEINESRNQKRLRTAFETWKNLSLTSKKYLKLGMEFHERKLLNRIFKAWKLSFYHRRSNRAIWAHNEGVLKGIIVKNYLWKWQEINFHKRKLYIRAETAVRKHENRLKIQVLQRWHGFVEKLKSIREAEEWFPEVRSFILLKTYVHRLLEGLQRNRTLKTLEALAGKTEQIIILRKYLKRWISFITWKKETVSKCMWNDKQSDDLAFSNIKIPNLGKEGFSRRQPMIPDYLKTEFQYSESDDSFSSSRNDLTHRIIEPINRRLPVVGQHEMFVAFDT